MGLTESQFSLQGKSSTDLAIGIVILPFVDISLNALSAACARGLNDELPQAFMKADGFRVSAQKWDSEATSPHWTAPLLTHNLGVQIAMEGTVRTEGNQLRVTAQLTSADGFPIWSQCFAAQLDAQELFPTLEGTASALVSCIMPLHASVVSKRTSEDQSSLADCLDTLTEEALLDERMPAAPQEGLAKLKQFTQAAPRNARASASLAKACCAWAISGVPDSAVAVSHGQDCEAGMGCPPPAVQARDAVALPPSVNKAGIFEALWQTHAPALRRIVRRIVQDPSDLDDILQTTMLKAYTHLDTFRGEASFCTWLASIALNEARQHRRRCRSRREITLGSSPERLAQSEAKKRYDTDHQASTTQDTLTLLYAQIASLPPLYQCVFRLRYIEEAGVEEIARQLGISVPATKSRLSRGRELLRARLERKGVRSQRNSVAPPPLPCLPRYQSQAASKADENRA